MEQAQNPTGERAPAGAPRRDPELAAEVYALRRAIERLAADQERLRRKLDRLEPLCAGAEPRPGARRGRRVSEEGLTSRELEVLRLVCTGLTDKEAAERLHLSPRTVHAHLRSIFGKLGVRTRAALVRAAIDRRLIQLG